MLEEQNKQLVKQLEEIQDSSIMYKQQICTVIKDLRNEKNGHNNDCMFVKELQEVIMQQNEEIKNLQTILMEYKQRLERYSIENMQLTSYVHQCEAANRINDEQTTYCHEEINSCLNNLQELKEKMKNETELVNQKVMEYSRLKEEYNRQCFNIEALRREIDNLNVYYKDEILELKHQVSFFFYSFFFLVYM